MYIVIRRSALLIALACVVALLLPILYTGQTLAAMGRMEARESVRLPILMYHSLIKNSARAGPYVLSPEVFEQDLKYLVEQGYTAVSASQLIAYVKDGAPLPEKPVMITFDDGFLNNLTYGVPLLEQYNMCAIFSVVGSYTDLYAVTDDRNPAYAYLSYVDICEAVASGYVEIGNHSYDMHRKGQRQGATRKPGESKEAYQAALREDLSRVQQSLDDQCGIPPRVFTFPFGRMDRAAHEVVREMGFEMSLGCAEVVNTITRDPDCLYKLGRFNRPAGISTEAFMKRIAE